MVGKLLSQKVFANPLRFGLRPGLRDRCLRVMVLWFKPFIFSGLTPYFLDFAGRAGSPFGIPGRVTVGVTASRRFPRRFNFVRREATGQMEPDGYFRLRITRA